jgi:hypothetical protein
MIEIVSSTTAPRRKRRGRGFPPSPRFRRTRSGSPDPPRSRSYSRPAPSSATDPSIVRHRQQITFRRRRSTLGLPTDFPRARIPPSPVPVHGSTSSFPPTLLPSSLSLRRARLPETDRSVTFQSPRVRKASVTRRLHLKVFRPRFYR